MISKPMYTLLITHLQSCREPGTSIQESGIKVSTEKQKDETIVFFHTDCDEGRKGLQMEAEGKKISDYLIYYTKKAEKSEVICLLELKGTKLETAVKQVTETHEHVDALSKEEIHSRHHSNFKWRICICLHGTAPSISQRLHDQLKQKFEKENIEIKHGVRRHDIGPLLRRVTK